MNQDRFAELSEAQLNALLSDKNAKKTKEATKNAASIFHEYCIARRGYRNSYSVDTLQADAMDTLLESFYAEARNKK